MTSAHDPNVPQPPPDAVAEARWTTPELVSRPAPESVPSASVRGIESVEKSGPPPSVTVCPVGPVVSLVSVSVAVEVWNALSSAVIVCAPGEVVDPAVQLKSLDV